MMGLLGVMIGGLEPEAGRAGPGMALRPMSDTEKLMGEGLWARGFEQDPDLEEFSAALAAILGVGSGVEVVDLEVEVVAGTGIAEVTEGTEEGTAGDPEGHLELREGDGWITELPDELEVELALEGTSRREGEPDRISQPTAGATPDGEPALLYRRNGRDPHPDMVAELRRGGVEFEGPEPIDLEFEVVEPREAMEAMEAREPMELVRELGEHLARIWARELTSRTGEAALRSALASAVADPDDDESPVIGVGEISEAGEGGEGSEFSPAGASSAVTASPRPGDMPSPARVWGTEIANRVARVLEIQDEVASQPISRVVLRIDPEGGGDTRVRLGVQGSMVEAEISLRDPSAAQHLQSRVDELSRALQRQGLIPGSLRVEGTGQGIASLAGADRGAPSDGGRGDDPLRDTDRREFGGRDPEFDDERSQREQRGEERR